MIEDEELSNRMVKSLSNYYWERRRTFGGFSYRLTLFAYPNERYVDIKMDVNDYPQGYLYDIEQDFKYHANVFFNNYYSGWTYKIVVV